MEGDGSSGRREEELVKLGDGEPGVLDRRSGVPPEVAAAEQVRPDCGVEQALQAGLARIAGEDMFKDPELPAWLKHSVGLSQGRVRRGDCAQGEAEDSSIEAGIC